MTQSEKTHTILDTGATSHYYPEPTPEPTRVRITAGGNLVAPGDHRLNTTERSIQTFKNQFIATPVFYTPVVHSLEFRQAWKTIVDEHNNTTQKKSKKRNRRSSR